MQRFLYQPQPGEGSNRLGAYYARWVQGVCKGFAEHYLAYKTSKRYRHRLPLERRGWQMSLVEGESKGFSILSYVPGLSPGMHQKIYPRRDYADMPKTDDVAVLAEFLELGRVVSYREFTFPMRAPTAQVDPLTREEIIAWAEEMAEMGMRETHPTLDEAKERMQTVYGESFVLERMLRALIEKHLSPVGADWFDKLLDADENLKKSVEDAKNDPRDFTTVNDTSPMRYVPFSFLRPIVMGNRGKFPPDIVRRARFRDAMENLEPLRNKVCHMYILAANDLATLHRDVEEVMRIIRPHVPQL